MILNLSNVLKRLRREKNMTQEEVASYLGVTFQSVSRWENGLSYPDIELLPAIAALFGVSLDRLFGLDGESEEAKIRQFDAEAGNLSGDLDGLIRLAKKYISESPQCAWFRFCLLEAYHGQGAEIAKTRLDEMRSLCRFVIEHTTDADKYRYRAIVYMIAAEEDDKVKEWFSLLDNLSTFTSSEAERERYYYRFEVDNYNRAIQKHLYLTMIGAFNSDFCKLDEKTYKNAGSRAEGQKVILKIMDAMRDPNIEIDAWVFEREFAFRRLAAGCFGAGETEEGYAAMEKSVELFSKLCELPEGTELKFNSPVLDTGTRTVSREETAAYLQIAYNTYTIPEGWEWFNSVRNEKRYASLVSRLKELADTVLR